MQNNDIKAFLRNIRLNNAKDALGNLKSIIDRKDKERKADASINPSKEK